MKKSSVLFLLVTLLTLALILLFTACDAAYQDENQDDNQDNGLHFTLSDGTYSVTDYTGSAAEVCIPAIYKGVAVTSIGDEAFQYCDSLTAITIPDSVTSIADDAFSECENLSSITIGDSVTSIGNSAFFGTSYYEDGNNWEKGVLYIGKYLIDAKTSLSGSYQIKEGTICIGDDAFMGCNDLTAIVIPDSVISIGETPFSWCSDLDSITVNGGNKIYHSAGNCIIETASKTLISGCKTSVIPKDGSVTSIGHRAFEYCSFSSIDIPDSVTKVGDWVFSGCYALTSINIPETLTSIGRNAFDGCSKLAAIIIPDSVISIGRCAFYDCDSLTAITIGDSVTCIEHSAFEDCDRLVTVTIGNSVTTIENWAFSDCDSLTTILIPESVTSIGSRVFEDCPSLTSITFKGTKAEWNVIARGVLLDVPSALRVYCTDGTIIP